jgi:hypothetical protein
VYLAFSLASRALAGSSESRGKATPRRGCGSSSLLVGRGSGSGQHVEDNGGTEGKTIPIVIDDSTKLGEIDTTYHKYCKYTPKRRQPTKYDSFASFEQDNYDASGVQVKRSREENPYLLPKYSTIDYHFSSIFHFNFYGTALVNKSKIIKMKWVDFEHLEDLRERCPEMEDVLELIEKYKIRDLMGFKYDWKTEILAQFHATFFYDIDKNTIHWMTERVHYKLDFVTFARLLRFV